MKLLLKTPIHFRGTPKRAVHQRDFLVARVHECDVPEITEAETRLVIETRQVFAGDGMLSHRVFRMIAHGEKLYRRLDSVRDAVMLGLFERGFTASGSALEFGSCISSLPSKDGSEEIDGSPLSFPIQTHIEQRLFATHGDRSTAEFCWPRCGRTLDERAVSRIESRDAFALADTERHLADVDEGSMAAGLAMCDRQASRLLIVDGDIWYETAKPCLTVGERTVYLRSAGTASAWSGGRLTLSVDIMPETYCPDLAQRRFPLEASDEAMAYMERLQSEAPGMPSPRDLRVETAVYDREAVAFDATEELVFRVGSALTTGILAARAYPGKRARALSYADTAVLAEAERELLASNLVMGDRGDFTALVQPLLALWLSSGMPVLGRFDATFESDVNLAVEMAVREMDERPIDTYGIGPSAAPRA